MNLFHRKKKKTEEEIIEDSAQETEDKVQETEESEGKEEPEKEVKSDEEEPKEEIKSAEETETAEGKESEESEEEPEESAEAEPKESEEETEESEEEPEESEEEPEESAEAEPEESEEEPEESEEEPEEAEEEPEESEEESEESEEEPEEVEEEPEESEEEEPEDEEEAGYDEDLEETGQEHVQTKHHRGRRKHMGRKILKGLGVACGIILILAAVVYFGMALFFNSHFLFYTTINGVDQSLKNVSQVEEYMDQQVSDYVLTLEESDGSTETIKGSDISTKYVPGDQLTELVESQNVFLWPQSLWDHPEIEASVGVSYDEEALAEVITGLNCTNEENQVPSENAVPVYQVSEFVVQPEVIGTELNMGTFTEAVNMAVNGFQDDLDMAAENCYMMPEYTSTSPEVIEAADKMNEYLQAQITYDMSPDTVVVGASEIAQWVKVDQDTMEVSLKQGSVKDYISELASQYDTYGHDREFQTASGRTVTVKGGDYGWKIDQDAETEALLADIQEGNVVEREPAYSHTAKSHGSDDLGNTYAEVDLTNQHMYYTKDGSVVLESDVVTGNPNKGNGTPQGTYSITFKERNAVLRGDVQSDGSYGYETPVAYWMPFNGGIGFHDATWQSSFGGERYLTHGSHGCVNMPKSKAEELYGMISTGDPVVCYY